MVASATRRLHDPRRIRRLRDLGGIPERSLHLRAVPLALLFAGAVGRSADGVVRRQAGMVARAAALFTGPDHPALSRPVPRHLLLLSRRLLQGILGRSAELRRG